MKVSYDQHMFWSIPIKFNQMHILSCEIFHCGFYNFCKYSSIWKCKSNALESIYNLGFLVKYSVCTGTEWFYSYHYSFFIHDRNWNVTCTLCTLWRLPLGLRSPLPIHRFRKVLYKSVMPFSSKTSDDPWNGKGRSVSDPFFAPF